jgi:hypothetical protein
MNLNTILKLFGLDTKKPLDFLLKILLLVDEPKLIGEVQSAMCLKMTDKRKSEVAGMLKQAGVALEAGDCPLFAKTFVGILKGIKL